MRTKTDLYSKKFANGGEVDDDNLVMQDKQNDDNSVDVSKDLDPVANDQTAPSADQEPDLSPDAKSQQVRDWLEQQYGNAADTSGIDDAREQAATDVQKANLSHGISQMLMAGSQAEGGPGASQADYQEQLKQARTPISQAEEDRGNTIKDFLAGNQLGRQSDLDQQNQKGWAVTNDANDPTSQDSLLATHLFESQFPDALRGWTPEQKAMLTKNDVLKMAMPGAETAAKLKQAQQLAQMRFDWQRQQAQVRQDQMDDKALSSRGKDLDSMTASSRSALGTAAGKVRGGAALMTFTGTSPDEVAAGTAQDSKGNWTNPQAHAALVSKLDAMPPQQYAEVVSGLMNQVSPGAGSLGQFEHLRQPTAEQTAATVRGYFSSNPVPAGSGEIIAKNLGTINNEMGLNQRIIDAHNRQMDSKYPGLRARRAAEVNSQDDAFTSAGNTPQAAIRSEGPVAPAPTAAPTTRVIGGKTYVKVPGGWKAQ